MYLTVVIDLFNREVIGWNLSNNLETNSIIEAFNKSYMKYKPKRGCVLHSDREVQYASKEFRMLLRERGMIQSMSRRGDCYDNACAETFFKTLKVENIYHQEYKSEVQAKRDLFE
jgi:putative transposase